MSKKANSKLIGQRINTALELNNIKQKELAQQLGVKDNVVSYWCSGSRTPNTEQIVEIADFLKVSTDYLLGVSEVATTDKDIKFICEFTGLNEETVYHLNILSEGKYYNDKTYDFYEKYIDFIFNKNINVISYFNALLDADCALSDLHSIDVSNKEQLNQYKEQLNRWCKAKEKVDFCEFRFTKAFNKSLEDYTKHFLYKCKQETEEITGRKFQSKLSGLLSQYFNKE